MKDENVLAVPEAKPFVPLDASVALCEHIQIQGYQSRLFSDITLSFLGKEYLLHKIILSQSSYFLSLLSGPWKENGKARIELQIDDPNVTVDGLESALAYMYGVSPVFTVENVVSILAAGSFLGLENLCESSVQFALQDLRVDTFVRYQHLSEKHCYGKFMDHLRNACWSLLCSHASRELLHYLPELSLQVLCHLLKSDELWIVSEAERYKLAKQALIDWKLARIGSAGSFDGSVPRKTRSKSSLSRKLSKGYQASVVLKNKNAQRAGRTISKDRSSKKKGAGGLASEQKMTLTERPKEGGEVDLLKLQRLWEEDSGEQEDGCKGGYKLCTELFTDGGIIFSHMEADEVLRVRKELEDANLPPDAANDSIWHSVLLKAHVLKSKDSHNCADSSSDDDSSDEEMEEDDEDDVDSEDDDEELSERDTNDSDGWSTETSSHQDDSNSSEGRDREAASTSSKKLQNSFLVCFNCLESSSSDELDPKWRRTTGGFTWTAKPDIGMKLANFPPFRFGAEFVMKDEWVFSLDIKYREVFYGGSKWMIVVVHNGDDSIRCQLRASRGGVYGDPRKKGRFMAKLYVKTRLGLRGMSGIGLCGVLSSRHMVSVNLARKDVAEDEPLRVSAVVQLVDD